MPSSPTQPKPRRRKPVVIWALLGIAVATFVVFPPVRIHRYPGQAAATAGAARAGGGGGATGAVQPDLLAQRFWDERLLPAAAKAADAGVVIAAVRADPAAARKQYARTPAIGGPSYFFISGVGRVVSQGKNELALSLDDAAPPAAFEPALKPDLTIGTGPLFGNAVRDGTGLLDPAQYPNSGDYNAMSAELNKLVRARVLPALRDRTAVGSRVRFAGIAEMTEDQASPLPLQLVPVSAEVQ